MQRINYYYCYFFHAEIWIPFIFCRVLCFGNSAGHVLGNLDEADIPMSKSSTSHRFSFPNSCTLSETMRVTAVGHTFSLLLVEFLLFFSWCWWYPYVDGMSVRIFVRALQEGEIDLNNMAWKRWIIFSSAGTGQETGIFNIIFDKSLCFYIALYFFIQRHAYCDRGEQEILPCHCHFISIFALIWFPIRIWKGSLTL